jgi:hypothetical protein
MGVELMPRAGRRIRVTAGVVVGLVAVLLMPGTAAGRCVVEPFAKVVRKSDTVLVATVVEARPAGPHRTGIIVRLNVEEVLKGSAADGERVRITSCGPSSVGSMNKSWAKHEIGQRSLFLLSRYGATVSQYSEVTSPQGMTLDQKITRAHNLLGIPGIPFRDSPAQSSGGGGSSPWPWAIGAALIAALGGAVVFVRRTRGR